MKTLPMLCLIALTATAAAQDAPPPTAKADAEEAKTRRELEEARERLDKAAREVAELSGKLGASARREIRLLEPRRAVLGVQIEPDPGKKGARVLRVSPGGPAAEAGLRDDDVIVALDGQPLAGPDHDRALVTRMRDVKPEQKVRVAVLRDGRKHDYVVVARPPHDHFTIAMPEAGAMARGFGPMPFMHQFRSFWPAEFDGLELATITPKLGAYFGVSEGVLVVQAPRDDAFKLEDGDVLQSIDGRKPDDGPHALRILRSYQPGEKLSLTVLRQRKPVTLAVTMPDRPERDVLIRSPEMPGVPPAPPVPPGATTFEIAPGAAVRID